MSKVRTYTMPATSDERLRLLAEIERDAAEVLGSCSYERKVGGKAVRVSLGFTVSDRHRKTWNAMSMPDLRRCASAWAGAVERCRAYLQARAQAAPPSPAQQGLLK